jgi:hypothetical protein
MITPDEQEVKRRMLVLVSISNFVDLCMSLAIFVVWRCHCVCFCGLLLPYCGLLRFFVVLLWSLSASVCGYGNDCVVHAKR